MAKLSTDISGITTAQLVQIFGRSSSRMPQSFLTMINMTEIGSMLNESVPMLSRFSIGVTLGRFGQSVRVAQQQANHPIVFSAFSKGITIAQLPSYNLIDLAQKITGIPSNLIKILYKIPDSDFQTAKSLTIAGLPTVVKTMFNVQFQVKHFYTFSFASLANAFLVHKNITEGSIDFLKDFGYILRNVSLSQIQKVYGISSTLLSQNTFLNLAASISGITQNDFAKVLRYEANRITVLNGIPIRDVFVYFDIMSIPHRALSSTMGQLIPNLLLSNTATQGMFSTVGTVLLNSGNRTAMSSSFSDILSASGVLPYQVDGLFKKDLVAQAYFNLLKGKSLQNLFKNKLLSIAQQTVNSFTIFKLLRTVPTLKGKLASSPLSIFDILNNS